MASLTNRRTRQEESINYFGKIKFVLKVFGVSFKGNESVAYKIYSILIVLLINVSYTCLDFIEIFKHDIDVVANNILLYLFPFTLASVKTVVVLRNRIKFGQLLDKLEQEPFISNSNRGGEVEEKLVKECVWITTAQTLTYWILGVASITVGSFVTLRKRITSNDYHDWEFTYGPFTVLNVTYSPNYEISWIYQTLTACTVAAQFSSIDLITAAVLAHISYQFRILQNNIRRLLRISYEEMRKENGSVNLLSTENSVVCYEIDGSQIPWKYMKTPLKRVVNYHLAIISVAEEMETIFSSLFLVVFLSTLCIICFLAYHASLHSLNDPMMWMAAGEVACACVQVLITCYWGEQVIFESQEVGRAAYETNFAGTDLRFQKSLGLIICRSQHPTTLTAGKFSALCLPTFAWIIRTSYSAFMMLQRTQQINKK